MGKRSVGKRGVSSLNNAEMTSREGSRARRQDERRAGQESLNSAKELKKERAWGPRTHRTDRQTSRHQHAGTHRHTEGLVDSLI